MGTLDELIFYCKKENPIGALALYGESGSGKTYLIDQSLQEALKDTHFIVLVSLFGVSSIETLHTAVKKQWLYTCRLLLSKLDRQPSHVEKRKGFFKIVHSVLNLFNPQAEKIIGAMTDPLEYVVITPTVEEPPGSGKKRVVLVFDDVDRSKLEWNDLTGTFNDYCENLHFNTILIANKEYLGETDPAIISVISAAKEKTVAYTVLNHPNFGEIVHHVISSRQWPSEEYKAFLKEHEGAILEVFASTPQDLNAPLGKRHNIRSLITSLESFNRVFYHMTKAGIRDIEPYLCSFIAFYLASKGGITKDGIQSYTPTDEEIRQLYPRFSADTLLESVRQWIRFGYWDRDLFSKELARFTLESGQKKENGKK